MSLSLPDPTPKGSQTPFAFLRRLGRERNAYGPEGNQAKMPFDAVSIETAEPEADAPAESSAFDWTEQERGVLQAAEACAVRHNWLRAAVVSPLAGGLYLQDGELCAWAVDQGEPLRPVTLAVIVDGVVLFEAWTDPDAGSVAIATGYRLQGHRTLEFLLDNEATAGAAASSKAPIPRTAFMM